MTTFWFYMIFYEKILLRVNYIGKYHCFPGWVWDRRKEGFPDYDLWFVVSGQGRMTARGETRTVGPGDCYLLRPKLRFYADNDHDAPLNTYYAHFHLIDEGGRVINHEPAGVPALRHKIEDSAFFVGLFQRMLESYYQDDLVDSAVWLEVALREITRQQVVTSMGHFSRQALYFRKLLTRIQEFPERRHAVKDLAAERNCSPEHFSRLFKTHIGMTFRECVGKARLNRAKQLLSFSEYSIERVAEICGYPDMYLFSKQFKKKTTLTPTQYRAQTT